MKYKILITLILFVLLFSFTGCAECISTEYQDVEVTVVDEYYRGSWVQPVWTGKSMAMIPHSAEYNITVEYDGVTYNFYDEEIYYAYKDRVGEVVPGKLEIKTYDDGSIWKDIVSLE